MSNLQVWNWGRKRALLETTFTSLPLLRLLLLDGSMHSIIEEVHTTLVIFAICLKNTKITMFRLQNCKAIPRV